MLYKFIKFYFLSAGAAFLLYEAMLPFYAGIPVMDTGIYIVKALYNTTQMDALIFALWLLPITAAVLFLDHFIGLKQ